MTGNAEREPKSFAFGPYRLIPEQQLLLKGDERVRLGGRAFDILTALVERSGEVVGKEDLVARVWPTTTVEEGNLKVNLAALRKALGDGPNDARFIATVIGRGYRFVSPVRAEATTPATETLSRRHNLPFRVTRLLGRAEAVADIAEDLGEARTSTVVGPGGIGKSSVALSVAWDALDNFADGVCLVDLSRLGDPTMVAAAIAAELGLAVHSTDVVAALCAYLRPRRLLLLLDSCESALDPAATVVARILAEAPGVAILSTSREPLRIAGERIYRVPPLEAPQGAVSASDALAYPAVELFVDRATETSRTFALTDHDAPIVADICRKLDGLALAIELAAARVGVIGVRELHDLLDDRFRVLGERRSGPERHHTLAATIDWSYDALNEAERQVLRRLSSFAGVFDLESACAVAADAMLDRSRVVEAVADLTAKSLLSAEPRGARLEYRLLDTTRSYALEKLLESGELDLVRQRHAAHVLAVAEQAGRERGTWPRQGWLSRYGSQIDDLRGALRWAFSDTDHFAIGVRLTLAAIPFWEELSLVEECRIHVVRALADDCAPVRTVADELKLYMAHGTALFHTIGPHDRVKASWAKAAELAQQDGDRETLIRCLGWLADFDIWTGELKAALAVTERIRAMLPPLPDPATTAAIDMRTGAALRYAGDLDGARRYLENSLATPRGVGTPRFEFDAQLTAQGAAALVYWSQGLADRAVDMARRQREAAEALTHAVSICSAYLNTSCPIALELGDLEQASDWLDFIEQYVADHGLSVWKAMAACLRGRWLLDRRDGAGLAILNGALSELQQTHFRVRFPVYLGAYAEGLADFGDVDGARRAIGEAIGLARQQGQLWCMPELVRIDGWIVEAARGDPRVAARRYRDAIGGALRQGSLALELRAASSLVRLTRSNGGDADAETGLRAALDKVSEGRWSRDVRLAEALLAVA